MAGTIPKSYLGIALGILAAIRNVGMVQGIAFGGVVLYAFSPYILCKRLFLKAGKQLCSSYDYSMTMARSILDQYGLY